MGPPSCNHELKTLLFNVPGIPTVQENYRHFPNISIILIKSGTTYYSNSKMAMAMQKKLNVRLPPEVNRILYVRNLPYKITSEEMYDIFGKYGAIRQIRVGNTPETRGTAFVVYEDIFDAKNACDHLSGFNVCNRFLVVLYYQANKAFEKLNTAKKEDDLQKMKEKYGLNTPGREATAK